MVRQISSKPTPSPLTPFTRNLPEFTSKKPNISNLTYVITIPIFSLFKKETWTQHGLRVILFTACVATGIYFIKKRLGENSTQASDRREEQLIKVVIGPDEKSGLARVSSSGGTSSRFSLQRADSMGRAFQHGPGSPHKRTYRRTKTREEHELSSRLERSDSEGSVDEPRSSRVSDAGEKAAALLERLREQKQAAADRTTQKEAELSAQARETRERAFKTARDGERLANRGDMQCGPQGCCTVM
ncbi:MAG: hypothetical protein GWP59_00140 [Chlamydiales bacterium]|nr:hypothetical protein [Chlamydiales bacterium]